MFHVEKRRGGAERYGLPPEVVSGVPRVTLSGAGEVMIENHSGLKCYTRDTVEVRGRDYTLRIRGEDLSLDGMTKTEIYISGLVAAVEFC